MKWIFLAGLFVFSFHTQAAQVVRLEDVLAIAVKESEELKSFGASLSALEAEIRGRDYVLSSEIKTELSKIKDRREAFTGNTRKSYNLLDVTFTQPFATGTELSFNTGYEIAELNTADDKHVDWELSLSQSLWQDFFGRMTTYRRELDSAEFKSRKYGLVNRIQVYLMEVEHLYWELALASRELEIRIENLKRSQRIETWVKNRLARSAADPADLLQAQALVTNRELQIQNLNDRLESAWNQFRGVLPSVQDLGQWKPDLKQLETPRAVNDLIHARKSAISTTPIRLDALALHYETLAAQANARLVDEKLKPSLNLNFAYGQNGVDEKASKAFDEAMENTHTYTKVGLVFSTPLDFGLKNQQRQAANLSAEGQRLRAQRLKRESHVQWQDIQRELGTLQQRIETAEKLFEFQKRKSDQERRRYEQGRTTAFQAITFEQEAAEAELLVLQLQVQMRKTEARARLYTTEETKPL